jgi:hypothetical protein
MAADSMSLRERVLADAESRMLAIKSGKYAGSRPVFEVALERWHFDLAAHCLMVGAVEALREMPPDALEALMDEIEGEFPSMPARRRHSQRSPRGRRH